MIVTPDYKKMYLLLFNAATDAIRELDSGLLTAARMRLVSAQQQAEEMFLAAAEQAEKE